MHSIGSDISEAFLLALKILQTTQNQDGEPRIDTLMDIRHGSKLNKHGNLLNCAWGFSITSNRIGTGCSNGSVIIWDIESRTESRIRMFTGVLERLSP